MQKKKDYFWTVPDVEVCFEHFYRWSLLRGILDVANDLAIRITNLCNMRLAFMALGNDFLS